MLEAPLIILLGAILIDLNSCLESDFCYPPFSAARKIDCINRTYLNVGWVRIADKNRRMTASAVRQRNGLCIHAMLL